jgi:hypothetical protein
MKWMAQFKLATAAAVGLLAVVAIALPLAMSQTPPPAAHTSGVSPPTEAIPSKLPADVAPAILTKSQPVEKDGLSVVIRPQVKSIFSIDEPLILQVDFHNTTKEAFRLPQGVVTMNWQLIATDLVAGKTFTGGGSSPGFNGGPIGPGEAIAPGETYSTAAVFENFHFFEGAMEDAAVKNRVFQEQITALKANNQRYTNLKHPLPPGRYNVSVNIRFPKKPDNGDTIPIWKDDALLTDTVEVTIGDGDTTVGHLLVTRFYLERALAALRKEPVENHGGHIEQAIINANRALTEVADAIDYVKSHPETDPLPPTPLPGSPQQLPTDHPLAIPPSLRNATNRLDAIPCLQSAHATFSFRGEVTGPNPGGAPRLVRLLIIGELGGHRDSIFKWISETANEVVKAGETAQGK